jgi:hypothetical protein
VLDEVGV